MFGSLMLVSSALGPAVIGPAVIGLIGNLDTTELLIVLVGAVLVFGKRLPEVAAQAGSQLSKLRRTLDDAWKESGVDKEVRDMQRSIESIRDAVPRDLSAASIARTAATKFQARVEANQRTSEETAAELAAATQDGASAGAASDAVGASGTDGGSRADSPAGSSSAAVSDSSAPAIRAHSMSETVAREPVSGASPAPVAPAPPPAASTTTGAPPLGAPLDPPRG